MQEIVRRFFPESDIDDFTTVNGTVQFYLKVKALYPDHKPRVLDFGAGRGAWTELETSKTIRQLRDLRIGAQEVVAADIDDAVLTNTCSHVQVLLEPEKTLPFPDEHFDLIVADYAFEHIVNPSKIALELVRVLRPGGWICARTANKFGYVTLVSRILPNRLHVRSLKTIQPDRKSIDVFPTAYKLNSPSDIRKYFPGKRIVFFRSSAEPAYHFDSNLVFAAFRLLHKLLPDALATGFCVFIQK